MPERFASKISYVNDCWIWIGSTRGAGNYGQVWHNGRSLFAHRVVYELLVGTIPDGLTLDHLCRNKLCVNPNHLEPVTIQENIARGFGVSALNSKKSKCLRGHEFNDENTYRYKGKRLCKKCMRIRAGSFGVFNKVKTHCKYGHELLGDNVYCRPDGGRECRTCKRRLRKESKMRVKAGSCHD